MMVWCDELGEGEGGMVWRDEVGEDEGRMVR